MKNRTKQLLCVLPLCILNTLSAQNLLKINTWKPGSENLKDFVNNGTVSENSREMGKNHLGKNVVLWKASPDKNSDRDGGWTTPPITIDHSKTYRLTVWIKKMNSNDGSTYFGFYSKNNGLTLEGKVNNNPYFWYGDLPLLNRWYLLVGYVHNSSYGTKTHMGAIYDGVTGKKVKTITDFKFKNTAKELRHRAYLFYDRNTSDSQYFSAPRMEVVTGREPSVSKLLGIKESNTTNLLNTDTWKIGAGSVIGYTQNGSTVENTRELGKNHVGSEVVLWKATSDAEKGPDGGYNTSYIPIDHTKTYRLAVWLKKTNSNDGMSYFGFKSPDNGLTLDGKVNNNPYFWYGDLPKLNHWYLLIGYVHGSKYTKTIHQGGIYDGVTGKKVKNITDFKFKNTATVLRNRAYLYYDTNTLDTQYFYAPRIDLISGKEPSILNLLKVEADAKVIVSYDNAGNQIKKFYCNDPAYCSSSPTNKQLRSREDNDSSVTNSDDNQEENNDNAHFYDDSLLIYPNPTRGYCFIQTKSNLNKIEEILVYSTDGKLIKKIKISKGMERIDLSNLSSGTYYLHFHLDDGKGLTKTIIKN